jgi:hypothetical protein
MDEHRPDGNAVAAHSGLKTSDGHIALISDSPGGGGFDAPLTKAQKIP